MSGTAVLVQFVLVVPWSGEREVLKFARVRSAKYRFGVGEWLSVAISVSPPPAHVGRLYLPSRGAAPVTHLKVFPPSRDFQTQLLSEESDPGTLV